MQEVLGSKALQWIVSMLVALFAVELQPVVGLSILLAFELMTSVHRLRENGLRGVERYRTTFLRELKRRWWAIVGLSMFIVFANVVREDVIKVAVFWVAGSVCLVLGWRNLMRGNPFMQTLWSVLVREMKEKGVDLDEEEVKA